MSDPRTEPGVAQPPVQPSSGGPAGVDATSDEMLLLGARMRDASALGTLFDRYGGLVYTLALRIVGERDLAEEVTQDVFLRCWHGLEQHDPAHGTLGSWLFGVTRGRALERVRGQLSRGGVNEDGPPTPGERESPAGGPVDGEEVGSDVRPALAELSKDQRAAIELAYYSDLTQSEVAERLGEPLGRVRMRIRDGLRRLRRVLGPVVDASPARERGAS